MPITKIQPFNLDANANYTFGTVTATNFVGNGSQLTGIVSGTTVPTVTAITYPGDDTAADVAGGQTVTLTGTGFATGAAVIINGVTASVVSVVNSTTITFTAPALTAGSYILYVVNTNGTTAIAVPGIQYSGVPTWTTAAGSLGNPGRQTNFTANLTVTGDAPITYSLVSGTLPTGLTLTANTGVLSGTTPNVASSTTYNFTIRSTDAQRQDTDRAFSITVVPAISIEMYAWGGGGGGAGYSAGSSGGGGGAAYAMMNIYPNSATSLTIVVGGGGGVRDPFAGPGTAPAGGGGTAGSQGYGGQGGGYSGIFNGSASQANALLIAGGGGGGGYDSPAGSPGSGGAGGGTTGQNGTGGGAGSGGTQSGSAGYPAGTALQGGSPNTSDGGGGGGGGGGYWGGGAGGNGSPTDSSGGGGSGYYNPSSVTSATLTTGSAAIPGDSSNSLRGSYGTGGTATTAGTQGVVIIRYLNSNPAATSTTGSPAITDTGGYRVYTWTTAGSITF